MERQRRRRHFLLGASNAPSFHFHVDLDTCTHTLTRGGGSGSFLARGEGDFLRVEGAAPSPCRLLLHRHSHLRTISPSTVRMQICCVMYCVHLILQSSAPAAPRRSRSRPTHRQCPDLDSTSKRRRRTAAFFVHRTYLLPILLFSLWNVKKYGAL
jgi:hypothetical protein